MKEIRQLFIVLGIVLALLITPGSRLIAGQELQPGSIQWHPFEWHYGQNAFFETIPNRVMLGNFNIGGLPEVQPFIISLNNLFSFVYENAWEGMVFRNQDFARRTETVTRVGNIRERILRDTEFSINRAVVGTENLRIIPSENGNGVIRGVLGFGMFHRNGQILIIDNKGSRFANVEALPEEMEQAIDFVPMKVEMGYLVIPVTIGGRTVEMFFDGTTRPAVVFYHGRTFRQLASSRPAAEELLHTTLNDELLQLEGFEPQEDIFFQSLPLSKLDVYRSSERAPSGIRGRISQEQFSEYIMVFDYRNGRFGICKPDVLGK